MHGILFPIRVLNGSGVMSCHHGILAGVAWQLGQAGGESYRAEFIYSPISVKIRGYTSGTYPIAEQIGAMNSFTLPFYPNMAPRTH